MSLRHATLHWVRLLHVYVGLAVLLLLLAYAASGLLLNHSDGLGARNSVLADELPQPLPSRQDELIAAIRAAGGKAVPSHVESVDRDEKSMRVVFARPGYRADAVLELDSRRVSFDFEDRGLAGMLEDLHRGKHVGGNWWIASDAMAAALLLLTLTGVVLWLSMPHRRRWGAIWLTAGLLATLLLLAGSW